VGTLPELIGLSNLITLDVSKNKLNGNIPVSWSQLSNLVNLDLSDNNDLSGTLPYLFWPSLKTLVISQTDISGPLLSIMTNFTSLGKYISITKQESRKIKL
jgi:hypothetical protein